MGKGAFDDQLVELRKLVTSLAERMSRRAVNERDDLIQEGMILCWHELSNGRPAPTEKEIEKRMTRWISYRRRQTRDMAVPYEKAMRLNEAG